MIDKKGTSPVSKGHFEQDRYWVSPYNFVPEVREGLSLPPSVQIHDATLRDGEQTPGVVMTKDDKIAIATKLSEVGIERIEAGMPAVSPQDAEAIREISALKLPSKIFTFARAMRQDIDCLLYTSPSPRDLSTSRMPSSA